MTTKMQVAVCRAFATMAVLLAISTPLNAAAQGKEKFDAVCAACHSIGGGKRVGPDLQGVFERRTEDWVERFVTSPQKMISSGDAVAVQMQQQFNMVMPDAPLSATEIKDVLAYIKTGGAGAAAVVAEPERKATEEDIRLGQELFQGKVRFEKGGPACNSCHDINHDAVIGGGVLARELSTVFSRMGGYKGLNALLGKAPFPVMEEAFRGKSLTEDESFALVSFLKDADDKKELMHPRDYGFRLFYGGIAGVAVLMGFFALFGRGRRRQSVNQEMFDRQVKTQ